MRALRFGILGLIGTLVYAAAVSSIGYGLGSDWDRVAGDLLIAGYVIAALLVAAITAFIIFRLCALRREPAEDPRLGPGRRRRPRQTGWASPRTRPTPATHLCRRSPGESGQLKFSR